MLRKTSSSTAAQHLKDATICATISSVQGSPALLQDLRSRGHRRLRELVAAVLQHAARLRQHGGGGLVWRGAAAIAFAGSVSSRCDWKSGAGGTQDGRRLEDRISGREGYPPSASDHVVRWSSSLGRRRACADASVPSPPTHYQESPISSAISSIMHAATS